MSQNPQKSKYKFLAKKGAGAFADVIEAQNTQTNEKVAIKRMKQPYESIDQITKLKELRVLKSLRNMANIVQLLEILFDRNSGKLALVFELLDLNLYEILKDLAAPMDENISKFYCFQAAVSLATLHQAGFIHRDIKPENMLLKRYNNAFVLKLADFGSSTETTANQPLTEYISTRWYRAPEILLSDGDYGIEIDIFALGCVFFEVLTNFPLFPGKDEADQLMRINKVCGIPSAEVFRRIRKNVTRNPIKTTFMQQQGSGVGKYLKSGKQSHIVERMIEFDCTKRCKIEEVLSCEWFSDVGRILESVKGDIPEENYKQLKKFVKGENSHTGAGTAAGKTRNRVKREPVSVGQAGAKEASGNIGNADGGLKLPTIVVKGGKK